MQVCGGANVPGQSSLRARNKAEMFSILFIKLLLPTGLKTSIRLSSVKFCEQLQKIYAQKDRD